MFKNTAVYHLLSPCFRISKIDMFKIGGMIKIHAFSTDFKSTNQ